MANEIKKYASLDNLRTFKENADETYETKEDSQLKYNELEEAKQNVLTGSEGQVVQFDANGNPVGADLSLITVDDIDTICGGAISYAEDVMF